MRTAVPAGVGVGTSAWVEQRDRHRGERVLVENAFRCKASSGRAKTYYYWYDLTSIGMTQIMSERYEKHLNEGKFLILVQGSDDELDKAQHILHTSGLHIELDRN